MTDSFLTGATVPPTVALALLQSLRAVDTPVEPSLEEEDLPQVLPRRLGLSSAVEEQIQRYARLRGHRGRLAAGEVASLFTLIARRPDARHVFAEAGRRLAEIQLSHHRIPPHVTRSILPGRVRYRLALRQLGHLAQRLNPGGHVRIERKPPGLIVEHCLPARAVSGSEGCALLGGAMEFLLRAYGTPDVVATHPRCEGRKEASCLWRPESQSD